MANRRATFLVRLVDANPSWVGVYPDGDLDAEPTRRGVMLAFDCPMHGDGCRIAVRVRNPIDGGPPVQGEPLWDRSGESFESLTLSPSIRVLRGTDGCQWHGHVSGGALLTCDDAR